MQPRLVAICLPSTDHAFARVVERMLSRAARPSDLEDLLRPLYPLATVRQRELSAELLISWYVYRDGSFQPPDHDRWWEEPGLPWTILDLADGCLLDANDALAEILGTERSQLVGRPYLEFVVPDAREGAAVLFETALATGGLQSTVRVLRPDGETVTLEVRAELQQRGIDLRFRRVTLVQAAG